MTANAAPRIAASAIGLLIGSALSGPGSRTAEAQVQRISLPAYERPWEQDAVVQAFRDHFTLGTDLWSTARDEVVVPGFVRSSPVWLIADAPDLVLYASANRSAWGFSRHTIYLGIASGDSWTPSVELCIPPYACGQQQIQPRTRFPGPFLSEDLRRLVYFKQGDIWRAEVDWANRTVVSHQQVTRVGVLGEARQGDITPLHWHGNAFFVRTRLSQERPILRVDLATGEIEELEPGMIFNGNLFANPSGSRLCSSHTELLACYDVGTRETFRMPLPHHVPRALIEDPDARRSDSRLPDRTVWVDDETLLVATNGSTPPGTTPVDHVLRIDFRRRQADEIFNSAQHHTEAAFRIELELLPGRRHAAAWLTRMGTMSQVTREAVRIAIEDGSTVTLPGSVGYDGAWLDDNAYVYGTAAGRLAEIGTWLYEIDRRSVRKVCHLPAATVRSSQNTVFLVPDRNALYFQSTGEGGGLFRADLGAGECRRVSNHTQMPQRLLTPPIDLRPGVTGDALWRAATTDGATPSGPAAPPATAAGPQGLERVLQALEGLPAETREEVESVYHQATQTSILRDYYDVACYALTFLEWRREHPFGIQSVFVREHGRFGVCADRDRIAQTITAQAARLLETPEHTEEQHRRLTTCVGETVADAFIARPIPMPRYVSTLFVAATNECRRTLGS